jgi:uncharacterized protein YciW
MFSVNQLVEWLVKAGPYAVTTVVLVWLKLERTERLAAQTDLIALHRQIANERKESATAMGELGEATRDRLREHDDRLDKVLTFVMQNTLALKPKGR